MRGGRERGDEATGWLPLAEGPGAGPAWAGFRSGKDVGGSLGGIPHTEPEGSGAPQTGRFAEDGEVLPQPQASDVPVEGWPQPEGGGAGAELGVVLVDVVGTVVEYEDDAVEEDGAFAELDNNAGAFSMCVNEGPGQLGPGRAIVDEEDVESCLQPVRVSAGQ